MVASVCAGFKPRRILPRECESAPEKYYARRQMGDSAQLGCAVCTCAATFRSALAVGRSRWDLLMAFSTAMTLPVVVVFFLAQRYFVQGVVMSGLKG
jgi:hypothetical protein